MGKIHGKDAEVYVNGLTMEDDGNRIGLTISPDIAETTSFGDLAKTNLEGLYGWAFDYDGVWNNTANANDNVFFEQIGQGGKEIKFFPAGSAASKIYYWGTAILNSYSAEATIGGAVTCRASLTGSGSLSRGTTAA